MNIPNRKLEKAIIAVISIGFVAWSAAFIYRSSLLAVDGKRYFCLFDDAMISMRYAWNFSHGIGLVWNPGEHIQGYTNLLMTLLMSFATLIFDKSSAVLLMQLIGICFMLANAFLTMRIANHVVQNESNQIQMLVRVLSFLCVLSYYPLVYWTLMGMETGMETLFLLLGVLFAFNYVKNRNTNLLIWMSGFLGLAYLTRNESSIFAVLVWAYIVLEVPSLRANRRDLYRLFGALSFYFLFVTGQLAFQYLYYGDLLPNTYTLKLTGMSLLARISDGVGFIVPFLKETALILVLLCVDLIFDFRKRKLVLFSIVLAAVAYQIFIGGDFSIYWRIISPAMPFAIILFINAIGTIVFVISNTQAFKLYFYHNPVFPQKYVAGFLVTSFTLVGLFSVNVRFLPEISLWTKPFTTEDNKVNVNAAVVLNQVTTEDATVGVYWAGSVPYFTGREAIDFLGKSDKYIAQLPPDRSGILYWGGMVSPPGHSKYDLNYSIKKFEPTFVQFFKYGSQNLMQWAATKYVLVERDGVYLFLLKGSPSVIWNKVNVVPFPVE